MWIDLSPNIISFLVTIGEDREVGYVFIFPKKSSREPEVEFQAGQFYKRQLVGFCHLSCVQYFIGT